MIKRALSQNMSQEEIRKIFKSQGSKNKGGTKIRDEFFSSLGFWCNDNGYKIIPEYTPFTDRKFRIDRAIFITDTIENKAFKIALEWEGVMSAVSGHLMKGVYTLNCEKYNRLSIEGWIVLRYTVINYKQSFDDIKKTIKTT